MPKDFAAATTMLDRDDPDIPRLPAAVKSLANVTVPTPLEEPFTVPTTAPEDTANIELEFRIMFEDLML